MIPVASTTALITSLVGTFWDVLSGPGFQVMGALLVVSIVFWAYKALRSYFGGRK